jgi:hypothetical protein
MLTRAETSETCGICLVRKQLVNFSDQCRHRFCHGCVAHCEAYQHDLCPICRTPRQDPFQLQTTYGSGARRTRALASSDSQDVRQEYELGSDDSERREGRMLLDLAGVHRHPGLDYFG